ncbi:unnamed protein product [Phytophthora fragariaefolia]|uniref:Unnamed protein product n=1 Tax=Phytophthora fragariaefolia TaxID=1490495 RepID=A0A9W6TRH0_9STRA|nr:unnamed protein product [Phytophthora fragariaefolia]
MPEFGTKMAPLTTLLRKSSTWTWGERQEEAFTWAKTWLSTKPVLIYPDYRLPFKLTTDASKTGLGAVLSQDQGSGDQPVAYASKVNSPLVAKYNISELECLAVVWAVRLFRPHLYGRNFTIVTDHVALKWLMSAKEPAGRLHRWALTLQEYDFEIQYRQDADNDPVIGHPPPNEIAAENSHRSEKDEAEHETAVIREVIVTGRDDRRVARDVYRPNTLAVSVTKDEIADEVARQLVKSLNGAAAVMNDELDADLEHAGTAVVRAAIAWRVDAAEMGIVQFTDDDIKREQTKSDCAAYYLLGSGVQRSSRQHLGRALARVVPPLRSVRTGDICDRWTIDVAGPLPVTDSGKLYVIAAVEYTTRYAVAEAVEEHTAKSIARFLINKVVLVLGPTREIMMDGGRAFGSQMITGLLNLLQAKQSTPVPYIPKLLGLVERFHRTWKNMVSLYINEEQDDWEEFLPCALYGYNGSEHATHGRIPRNTVAGLDDGTRFSSSGTQKEQARQAMYYNHRNVRHGTAFRIGQLVWIYRPARGPGITKFGHRWRGPGQIREAAGYGNYLVKMLESDREIVTHCSFLLSYYYPTQLLEQMAKDIYLDLRDEAVAAADIGPEEKVTEAQFDGLTGIAPVVTENNAVDNGNDASITTAASADAAAVENQQSVQDLDTSSGIVMISEPPQMIHPLMYDQPNAEAPKVVAAAPTDAIARRTRMQTQRDPRTYADRSNDRDQIDDADRATSRSRVSIMADHESATTRRSSSPGVSGLSNSATAQETATPRGDAEPVTEANARLTEQPQLQTTSPRQTKAATEEEAQITCSPARDGKELTASVRLSRDLITYDQMRPRMWINQRDYKQLWRDGRLQSIADSEDDGPQAEHNAESAQPTGRTITNAADDVPARTTAVARIDDDSLQRGRDCGAEIALPKEAQAEDRSKHAAEDGREQSPFTQVQPQEKPKEQQQRSSRFAQWSANHGAE